MSSQIDTEPAPEPLAVEGEHVAPAFNKEAYHCPYCGVLAPMFWTPLQYSLGGSHMRKADAWRAACNNCSKAQIWALNEALAAEMVRPTVAGGPRPHTLMPDKPRADYVEAQSIVMKSPRGACALLRLATQELVNELEPGDADLNDKIAGLVKQGLPEDVSQALDILRVTGNHAVHPGEMDLRDDVEMATSLFECINVIVEERIARKRQIGGLFARLPKRAREAIAKRDAGEAAPQEPPA